MMSRLQYVIGVFCGLALAASLQAQTQNQSKAKQVSKTQQIQIENQNPLLTDFKSFSATVSGGLARDQDRKVYRSGDLVRTDSDNGEYRITDVRSLRAWAIMGKQCAIFDKPDVSSYPFSAYHNFKAERSPTKEEETVDGHVCKIENVTLTPPDNRPIVAKMKLWEAKDLEGFPIKIELDEGNGHPVITTYSNVSLNPPDPNLFKHPAKCAPWMGPHAGGPPKTTPTVSKQDSAPPQR